MVPAIEALAPASTCRCRSTPGERRCSREALAAGAVVGNDISGFADPDYLPVRGGGRRVGGGHPHPPRARVPDPEPVYDEPSSTPSPASSRARAEAAEAAGIPRERVMVDAGLDLGKTEPQSLELLRAHDRLAALGWPLFLSASNKRFLGDLVGTDGRRPARGEPRRPRARHRARAAASCGPTTCAAPGAPPT